MTSPKNTDPYLSPQKRRLLNRISWIIALAIIALLVIPSLQAKAAQKQLLAQVDRQQIESGDVVKLVVQTNFETTQRPAFSVLDQQFERLGQQRSSRIEIQNGRYRAFSRWDLHLTPKKTGALAIPAFEVEGATSAPIALEVSPASKDPAIDKGPSFVEAFVDQREVYVQQQVHFTLRFYHLGQFINGNIRPPRFADALSFSLRNQFQYQKQIGANRYQVYEWTWVFFPQTSGRYTLPEQGFDGRIQYRGQLRLIQDRSEPITLTVKPIPNAYPKDAQWLPAQNLQVQQSFEMPQSLNLGQSLQRTITLKAQGLLGSQLPQLDTQASNGLSLYPKKPELTQKGHRQTVLSESKQVIEAMIQDRGAQQFQPIDIHWWNTQTDNLETLTLPGKTFTVDGQKQSQGAQFLPDTSQSPDPEKTTSNADETPQGPHWGLWLSVPALLLILYGLMRFRPLTQKTPQKAGPHTTAKGSALTATTNPASAQEEIAQLCLASPQPSPEKIYPWLQNAHPSQNTVLHAANQPQWRVCYATHKALRQLIEQQWFGQTPLSPQAFESQYQQLLTQLCEQHKALAKAPQWAQDTDTKAQTSYLAPLYAPRSNDANNRHV